LTDTDDTGSVAETETALRTPLLAPTKPAQSPPTEKDRRTGGWFSRGWHYGVTAAVLIVVAGAFFTIGWFASTHENHGDRAWIEETRQDLYPRERGLQRGDAGQKNPHQWPRQGFERQVPSTQQGYLGVGVITVTPELQQRYHLSTATGALVLSVDHTGPAFQTGVRRGDVITSIDGASVTRYQDVLKAVRAKKAGDRVTVVVDRNGQILTFEVTLEGRPTGAT